MIMMVTMPDGLIKSYTGMAFFVCLGKVRQEFSAVRFYVKAQKIVCILHECLRKCPMV